MPITTKPLLDARASARWLEESRRTNRRSVLVDSPDIRVVRTRLGTQLVLTESARRKLGI